jgi:hypothetical protein
MLFSLMGNMMMMMMMMLFSLASYDAAAAMDLCCGSNGFVQHGIVALLQTWPFNFASSSYKQACCQLQWPPPAMLSQPG